jgi:4-diphosphocytidyl-2-C-methyl-D-erythritol kinase
MTVSVLDNSALRLPAPAKINLTLRIIRRRDDGYHELQTVFQFLDWCDWLEFEPADDGIIHLLTPIEGLATEQDLTWRAARLLQEHCGCKLGVRIRLEKHLPMGGGIGGGSSDAATTLVALNHLWALGLSVEELRILGLRLGADVPVFIFGQSAWAEGVGEALVPMPELPEPWYVVLKPDCHVPTAEIFNAPELTRNHAPITMRDYLEGSHENHCVDVVCARYPEVGNAMSGLSAVAGHARLTGTGACIYSVHATRQEAQSVFQKLDPVWQCRARVTQGLNRSPLWQVLDSCT